jgi:hypothetical protein
MACEHNWETCKDCEGLPEPRIVRLHIDGVVQHFYTWSDKPLDDLTIGELKPYPALDAWAWLEGISGPRGV